MNSNETVFLFTCIFSIAAMNTVHFVSGQHEPLYIAKSRQSNEYYLVHDVRYDVKDQQLVVPDSDEGPVYLACPRNDDPNSLEVLANARQASLSHICKISIKSLVIKPQPSFKDLSNVIGFLVFIPDKEPTKEYYADVPKDHALVKFIHFKFDESLRRVRMVKYYLGAGKFLKPEISPKSDTVEYQKDEDIFEYDVDLLYSQTELPLVKVQLAPEDDFFFDNWKSASRRNILTAPMWSDLLPQWQALEIFTRKVNQIVDSLNVRTGVYDSLTTPFPGVLSKKMYLHDGKHPIPKYFWKSIYIETRIEYYHRRVYGILFVMHNVDPNTKSNEERIYSSPNNIDIISTTGWEFSPRTSIYACPINDVTLKFFQQEIIDLDPSYKYDFQLFDLHNIPVKVNDDMGRTTDIVRVNVLEEMQKLEQAHDDFTLNEKKAEQSEGGEMKSD